MAPRQDSSDVMQTSGRRPEQEGVDDYAIAAVIIAVILIVVIVAIVVCSCCQRHSLSDYCRHCLLCRPCQKRSRREDIFMGYIPANITVNSAALEQGVPDIFLRDSQAGRISIDPYSADNSHSRGDPDSAPETSGTWSEYLRRVVSRKGSSGGLEPAARSAAVPEDRGINSAGLQRMSQSDTGHSKAEGREVLVDHIVVENESGRHENGVTNGSAV